MSWSAVVPTNDIMASTPISSSTRLLLVVILVLTITQTTMAKTTTTKTPPTIPPTIPTVPVPPPCSQNVTEHPTTVTPNKTVDNSPKIINLLDESSMKNLSLDHHASCEVKFREAERSHPASEDVNETATIKTPIKIFVDPCDHPRLRMFMHCNPQEKRCECYRTWKTETGHVSDVYDKPEAWSDSKLYEFWFTYEKHAKECLILSGKKCGIRSEPTPYRCAGKGLCVQLSDEDNISYLCAGGGSISMFLSWKLLIWPSIVTLGLGIL